MIRGIPFLALLVGVLTLHNLTIPHLNYAILITAGVVIGCSSVVGLLRKLLIRNRQTSQSNITALVSPLLGILCGISLWYFTTKQLMTNGAPDSLAINLGSLKMITIKLLGGGVMVAFIVGVIQGVRSLKQTMQERSAHE